jgi:ribonuclease J
MFITVHRGTNEIGGSCVEIESDGNRVFIDAGSPLDGSSATLPSSINTADAIFISHCHQDHYGLLEELPNRLPVYMGEVGWDLICAAKMFRGQPAPKRNIAFIKGQAPIAIGGMKVTPYLVDHSAPDAYAFLIEAAGKKVFYTGDFRGHGRKAYLFKKLIQNPPQGIDALLLEGTVLGRPGKPSLDETGVENHILEALKAESGPAFFICSGQNVDRIVSAFRAAKRAGRKLVIDIYTAWILEQMSKASERVPKLGWPEIKVLAHGGFAARHYRVIKNNPDFFGSFQRRVYSSGAAIHFDDVCATPHRFLVKAGARSIVEMLDILVPQTASIIYSMWSGYMQDRHNPHEAPIYADIQSRSGLDFKIIHTSGHADEKNLVGLADALDAQCVIPIHTIEKGRYKNLFRNVIETSDGEKITV